MKKKKTPTNKEGEVRELTQADINAMRPAHEVLPPEFIATFPKRKQGDEERKKHPLRSLLRYATVPK